MVRAFVGLLGVVFIGCFHGAFLEGDPCNSDAECGPNLGCVDGLCGGLIEPRVPELELQPSQVKQFRFRWPLQPEAEYYQLLERLSPESSWEQLEGDIPGDRVSRSFTMPLHFRLGASYQLRACNDLACTDSAPVEEVGSMATAVGYVKASNTDATDWFGTSVAISGDGTTLAVGAPGEDSEATGINGSGANNVVSESGAVYVFVLDGSGGWSQQAYIKASDASFSDAFGASVALSFDGRILAVGAPQHSVYTDVFDEEPEFYAAGAAYVFVRDSGGGWSQQTSGEADHRGNEHFFGASVALSANGRTLAVGAPGEASAATGIDGNQDDDSLPDAGAVYVFARGGQSGWAPQAYVKASNTDTGDGFGHSVSLSRDGDTLAVGALGEQSLAIEPDREQDDDSGFDVGAAYVFVRDIGGTWSQQAYVKASNADSGDQFASQLALSADGDVLAVGASHEDSAATGVDGDTSDNSAPDAGAVYVFMRDDSGNWSQQSYLKASNAGRADQFGGGFGDESSTRIALSADGNVLAVGAVEEDSGALGIEGDQADDTVPESGAVYLFVRDDDEVWSQAAYLKASNTGGGDGFGFAVAISEDGDTLAVGAPGESSRANGVGVGQTGQDADNTEEAGAVYLY